MNYQQAQEYLNSFIDYEKIPSFNYKSSFKLERMFEFLKLLDNPQESLIPLQVAGTKGKGSTCAFLAYILREAGYKVGLYTSPHLNNFRERIRILSPKPTAQSPQPKDEFEGMISEDELVDFINRLKPYVDRYNSRATLGILSFFEVYTALAFLYFREKNVDFAILETGLGGRLDATNVVKPYVCGITPISYEHTEKLGNTLREIAREKVGIIKNPCLPPASRQGRSRQEKLIVISAPQEKEAIEVIRAKCKGAGAKLYEAEKDIFFEEIEASVNGELFNLRGIFGEYPHLKIRLLGRHQLINAATAIGMIESLRFYNRFIDTQAIRKGLLNTSWPGRFEIVRRCPLVILDGAQNAASASSLKETLKRFFPSKRIILVFGISKDKDIEAVSSILFPICAEVILTRADNPRAQEPKEIKHKAGISRFNSKITSTDSVREAMELAEKKYDERSLILVTGSLFVVGEARLCLQRALL